MACDRLVNPASCLRARCPQLYTHRADGRTWVGCRAGVFTAQVDLERLRAMQRTLVGFGGLRIANEPRPMCEVMVDRTFAHRGGPCVNPAFLLSDGSGDYTVAVPGHEDAA